METEIKCARQTQCWCCCSCEQARQVCSRHRTRAAVVAAHASKHDNPAAPLHCTNPGQARRRRNHLPTAHQPVNPPTQSPTHPPATPAMPAAAQVRTQAPTQAFGSHSSSAPLPAAPTRSVKASNRTAARTCGGRKGVQVSERVWEGAVGTGRGICSRGRVGSEGRVIVVDSVEREGYLGQRGQGKRDRWAEMAGEEG
eukprot:363161-Chlamydomonas_euryale.AAC.4